MRKSISEIFSVPKTKSTFLISDLSRMALNPSFITFMTDNYQMTFSDTTESPNLCYAHASNLREGFKTHYTREDIIGYIHTHIKGELIDVSQSTIEFKKDIISF